MYALELDNLNFHYPSGTGVEAISLRLATGEMLGLLGHNGAGKTTTIKLMLGLLTPASGQVRVLGEAAGNARLRQHVGYLPENVRFYPQLTGKESILFFARLKGVAPTAALKVLEEVGLGEARDRKVRTWSKGMMQRLGLAQALLGEPRLLILDEPTVGLDPVATRDLYTLLERLRAQGTAVVLCSHVLPGIERHLDQVAILSRGRLVVKGSVADLRKQANLPVRIRVHGLANRDAVRQALGTDGIRQVNAHGLDIMVDEHHKLDRLAALLAHQPSDVDIHAPSLEDLYCHFMQQEGGLHA
ncbi:ABC transporter ATP-binding protein [Hahella sp. SMD15-11]|uniref:ABC transporter ATP-binding protein n=1 Tax=Thermohahella caldifontis TaxID=3142973 RepID=A0AB39USH0_9GAMM